MNSAKMISRRSFLTVACTSGLALALPGCRSPQGPQPFDPFQPGDYRSLPALGLATSLHEEHDYPAEVEGSIPDALRGTLFRNGPGLFERGGLRKRCLLDGDGMVQAFRIGDGQVRYRNRFVRTRKYKEESEAGKYLYSTWSTQAPGGFWANLGGGSFENQAGVTVVVRDGSLYAFDEFHPPYRLDPSTLETLGVSWLGLPEGGTVFSAHSKIDPLNGDWIFFGLEFGRKILLHLTVLAADGALRLHRVTELPRFAYIHDFFVSQRHIILNLHPVDFKVWGFLLGRKSMIGAMRWRPELGNLVLIFDRESGNGPMSLAVEACWMWHGLNAFERGGEIIADFVGFRNPDHFLGDDPALFAIMEGRRGNYANPGKLRRYIIDPSARSIREEVLHPGNFEFPYVNLRHLCHRHRYGYFAEVTGAEHFFTGVSRIDTVSGKKQSFDFGPAVYSSEPIFIPRPGLKYSSGAVDEPGWVLVEGYDAHKGKGFLAIFDAESISDGPIARAMLSHHVPLAFHGFWHPERA